MSASTERIGRRRQLDVAVVGLWHLGSVAAGCLAQLGHNVVGVDDDAGRVASLGEGQAPLFEPGLDDLLATNIASGRLRFTSDFSDAISQAEVVCITYDTPVTDHDEVDISIIMDVVGRIAPLLKSSALLLIHSQVPVGTCKKIREKIRAASLTRGSEVVCIPENLRLGQAIDRFLHPDVLVIGAEDPKAYDVVEMLFAGIAAPWARTNLATAEMIKHAINAFLATCISFGNEIANLCQLAGADAVQVASVLHLERRVGPHVPIDPGMGFAGGTLARDMRVLQDFGNETGFYPHLVEAVLTVNEQQNSLPIQWLKQIYGTLSGLQIGVLGLTYKAGTSTLRRSLAVEVIRKLVAEGAVVAASDPKADFNSVRDLPQFEFTRNPYVAASGRDALLLITPWPEFKALDFERIRTVMRHPVLFDMPNALNREQLERLGFQYVGVGRGTLVHLVGH